MSFPGHATTPVAAAQTHAPSMTSFASENTYQTLDNATTDDESTTLLTAPELPEGEDVAAEVLDVDEPPIELGELLDVDDPGMDGPRIVLGDGNAISTFLQRLDDKWTNILTKFNTDLDAKHAFDVEQRRNDEDNRAEQRRRDRKEQRISEENRDEQRRRDREEQRLIHEELRTTKRMDLEAFLASSKDAFATEMKATLDGFHSELSTMRTTVSALSGTVKSLEDRVIRSQGQFTKTLHPSLCSRLDILEGRATQVPQVLAEEPPPAHPPDSTVPPPPAASPVVLRSDPPEDAVTPTPRRVHHTAPQSNAPMEGTPDPLLTSRAAYAAFRARMSHEAAGETIGHTDGTPCGATHEPDDCGPRALPDTGTRVLPRTDTGNRVLPRPDTEYRVGRNVTPHPSTPSQPSNRYRQPTIRESLFRGGVDIDGDGDDGIGHNRHTNFDFGRNGNVPPIGGPIISPRHSDRAMHARTLGASRFDVMKLASAEYHSGMDGVEDLSEKFIQDCGYGIVKATVEDVVVCFNDIIMVHRKVRDLWHNSYAHTLGPQVSTILTKHIKVFPKLDSLVVEEVVAFYDRLQEVGSNYLIALMPFDAIVLANRFEGLCPPGLGLVRYAAMSKALLELLPWLIPATLSPQVGAAITSVRYDTGNGYDFLWRILELTVPGFDPTTPIQAPIWSEILDIFSFAQEYLLFFRLQAKQNFHYNDRTRSGLFLRAVQSSQFADTITLLQSHINSYREEFEDGYLPPNLRLHGLATSLNQNAQSRLRDIATPRARRLESDTSLRVQGVPSIYRFERPRPGFGDREHRRDDSDRPRRREDSDRNKAVRFSPTPGTPARPREGGRRSQHGPGRLARPDRNRRPFMKDEQCAACRRVGHVAKHCDMLATAICLEKYMKKDLSPSLRDQIEKEWLDRWKEKLENPVRTPRQVLRSYVDDLGISVTELDAEMEWDCWDREEDDYSDEE